MQYDWDLETSTERGTASAFGKTAKWDVPVVSCKALLMWVRERGSYPCYLWHMRNNAGCAYQAGENVNECHDTMVNWP